MLELNKHILTLDYTQAQECNHTMCPTEEVIHNQAQTELFTRDEKILINDKETSNVVSCKIDSISYEG